MINSSKVGGVGRGGGGGGEFGILQNPKGKCFLIKKNTPVVHPF